MPSAPLSFEKRIPLALVLALFLQAGGAIWWASEKETQTRNLSARLTELEMRYSGAQNYTLDIVQRLARLETHAEDQAASLRRIENALSRKTNH